MEITCHKQMDSSIASFSIYQSGSNVWRTTLVQTDLFVLALALRALGFIFRFSNPTMAFLDATQEPITMASLFEADVNQLEIEKEVDFIVLLYFNVNRLHRGALSHAKEANQASAFNNTLCRSTQSNCNRSFDMKTWSRSEHCTALKCKYR